MQQHKPCSSAVMPVVVWLPACPSVQATAAWPEKEGSYLVKEHVRDDVRPSSRCCGSSPLSKGTALVHAPGTDARAWEHCQPM